MLNNLKITSSNNNILFVSDLHFGHNRDFIWLRRGFTNIVEHDETLIQRWNSVCTNKSIVFHLGDFIFGDPTGQKFDELTRRLNFQELYLLLGNHNSGQAQRYKRDLRQFHPEVFGQDEHGQEDFREVYPLWTNVDFNNFKNICFLPEYVEASINGVRFVLCHYPIYSHNKLGAGAIHLSGHCHGNNNLTNKDTGKGKRLDVGIESFGRPINLTEVLNHLKQRDLDVVDHHGETTK
jgi:calcineurin-like phosphoesterase family protein